MAKEKFETKLESAKQILETLMNPNHTRRECKSV